MCSDNKFFSIASCSWVVLSVYEGLTLGTYFQPLWKLPCWAHIFILFNLQNFFCWRSINSGPNILRLGLLHCPNEWVLWRTPVELRAGHVTCMRMCSVSPKVHIHSLRTIQRRPRAHTLTLSLSHTNTLTRKPYFNHKLVVASFASVAVSLCSSERVCKRVCACAWTVSQCLSVCPISLTQANQSFLTQDWGVSYAEMSYVTHVKESYFVSSFHPVVFRSSGLCYEVAMISRLLQNLGLFCRIQSLL